MQVLLLKMMLLLFSETNHRNSSDYCLTFDDVALVTKYVDVLPSDVAEPLITRTLHLIVTETTQAERLTPSFIHTPYRYKPAFLHAIATSKFGARYAVPLSCPELTNMMTLIEVDSSRHFLY
jgi:hypothetical protein